MSDVWKILFARATEQLRHANINKKYWSFGGGTVLKNNFDHRESKDIDIFFTDPQIISFVSPRINDATEEYLSDYTESEKFVKLVFPEGEVDFILANQITKEIPTLQYIYNDTYYVESPIEIIYKKIVYRYSNFTSRDVFDLAYVYNEMSDRILDNASLIEEYIDDLSTRIDTLKNSGLLDEDLNNLKIRDGGQKIRGTEYELCCKFIDELTSNAPKPW